MAEGPLVHHYVNQLKKVFQGRDVRIEFRLRKLKDVQTSFQSTHIQKVEAHGKQFRIHFSDHRILLIHLMMWGSWRFYWKGESWDKPIQRARVIFHTDSHTAVVFSAPVVKLLTPLELQDAPNGVTSVLIPSDLIFLRKNFFVDSSSFLQERLEKRFWINRWLLGWETSSASRSFLDPIFTRAGRETYCQRRKKQNFCDGYSNYLRSGWNRSVDKITGFKSIEGAVNLVLIATIQMNSSVRREESPMPVQIASYRDSSVKVKPSLGDQVGRSYPFSDVVS